MYTRRAKSVSYLSFRMNADPQYIVMHRVHPISHKGYMLVAHTAFKGFSGRGWSKYHVSS